MTQDVVDNVRLRVGLLEDDAVFSKLMQQSLWDAGYEVIPFGKSEDLRDYLTHQHIDALIADIFLREDQNTVKAAGLGVVAHLKAVRGLQIPIIVISGSFTLNNPSSKQMTRAASSIGADALLAKPFSPDKLLSTLARLLGDTTPGLDT